jgi:hypothetical protein
MLLIPNHRFMAFTPDLESIIRFLPEEGQKKQ